MLPRFYSLKVFSLTNFDIRRQLSLNVKALHDRGTINKVFPDVSEKFINRLASGNVAAYAGFDPTASSLHMGSILPLIALIRLQRSGIKPVIVIGGATAAVGDPSGKLSERDSLATDVITENSNGITKNVENIFANHKNFLWKSETKQLPPYWIVNNMSWYEKLNPVEFLGRIGRHFRMGTMLLKDSVNTRLKGSEGMSFAEFSYQAFQAYDWLYLYSNHDCYLQVGGNDQMGNMVAGHDLVKRLTGDTVHCFTVPLVISNAGDKMGKTGGNAVWLDPKKMSVFDFYQFFVRLPDSDVENYLKLFTFCSDAEIAQIMEGQLAKPDKRIAQRKIAEQVTLLVHGEEGLSLAKNATEAFFGSDVRSLGNLDPNYVTEIFGNAFVSNQTLTPDYTLLKTVMSAKCFAHEYDARRVIGAGGVQLNFKKADIPDQIVQVSDVLPNGVTLIRIGKKNYYVIRWNP